MNEIILTQPYKLDDSFQHDPEFVTYVAMDEKATTQSDQLHLVVFQLPINAQYSFDEWVQDARDFALVFDEYTEHTVTVLGGEHVHYLIAQAVAIGFRPSA